MRASELIEALEVATFGGDVEVVVGAGLDPIVEYNAHEGLFVLYPGEDEDLDVELLEPMTGDELRFVLLVLEALRLREAA